MKKILFTVFAGLMLATMITINGCKEDDTAPPVVSVSGTVGPISLNSSAVSDPGATANDEEDGAITTVTSDWSWGTNPNPNVAATYTINYTATDKAGNVGYATRSVVVRNDAYYLAGTYTTTEGASSWTQTITASLNVNNKIHFSKFANYSNNTDIYATVTGTSVDITTQNGVNIGASGCTHTFTPNGSGSPITGATGSSTFSIRFTDMQLVGGAGCPATGAVPYEDIFVQQ